MTTTLRAFGYMVLLVVVIGLLEVLLSESTLAEAVPDDRLTLLELWARPLLVVPYMVLPPVITAYLIAQALLILVWAFRTPRVSSPEEYNAVVRRLTEWLKWSFGVAAIAVAAALLACATHQRLTVLFLSLIPLFGWAYCVSLYSALQIHNFHRDAGRSRIEPIYLVAGAMLPMLVMPLWPVGLAVPALVLRSTRAAAAPSAPHAITH